MIDTIKSKRLKAVFKIEKLNSIKNVCGYDIEGFSTGYNFFSLTLFELNGKKVTNLSDCMELLDNVIPILIDRMKGGNECIIQLFGQLSPGELPDIYPFIFTTKANNRYYCPELVNWSIGKGYSHSWLSFEFNKDQLFEIPLAAEIIVKGFIVDKYTSDIFDTYYKKRWKKGTIGSLLKNSLLFFKTDSDFMYFSVATKIPMEKIILKWQEGLDAYDRGED